MNEKFVSSQSMPFSGLTTAEVEESRSKFGANELTPPKRDPWWVLYLKNFDDPVIRILIVAASIALLVGFFEGGYTEGMGILTAIFLATALAFVNEYKANQEFDLLNQVNEEVPIKVIRNGHFTTVPRKSLVQGDVILLEAGEEVPADGETLEAVSFQIDESRLTGESMPVEKAPADKADKTPEVSHAYPTHLVYRGSMVSDGHGVVKLLAVGDSTEIGKTARSAAEETDEQTPLQKQLARLSTIIGVGGFSIAGAIFVALVVHGIYHKELVMAVNQWVFTGIMILSLGIALVRVWLPIAGDGMELMGMKFDPPEILNDEDSTKNWLKAAGAGLGLFAVCLGAGILSGFFPQNPWDLISPAVGQELLRFFMISVTIIVVAVPEGLAMSVTMSLAYSMRKMTAENNLVRRLHACETIGAATVICSDKTGTLTMNRMEVQDIRFPCIDEFKSEPVDSDLFRELIIEAMCGNSTANLSRKEENEIAVLGNPTEGAFLMFLNRNGVDYLQKRHEFTIIRQWTFSTERKFMGTVGLSKIDGKMILHVKGAPEILLERCSHILLEKGEQEIEASREKIVAELKGFQARGMRTLGFAYLRGPDEIDSRDLSAIAQELTWFGFAAIADPIRPEVPGAFEQCRRAGVDVKIVTGDTSATAIEIANQAGLIEGEMKPENHMSGADFQELSEEEALKICKTLKVLSRARPMDKLKLVKLLKKSGEVVAVTGDGTNDAPALNHADVGLAMGKTGTSVAKEASDIILLDDSFPSIVSAILWGRSLYLNIQRFLVFQLTINVAALGVALIGPFIGVKMPLTVIQMLWVNLIMDTFAALALATEPPNKQVMSRPPRKSTDFIVTPQMQKSIFSISAIFLLFLITLLLGMQLDDGVMSDRDLSIFFSVFIMLQFWNLFNARCLGLKRSAFIGITENKAFLAIALFIFFGQIFIVQFGGSVFRTVPIAMRDWALIIGGTSVVLWIGEAFRFFLSDPNISTRSA